MGLPEEPPRRRATLYTRLCGYLLLWTLAAVICYSAAL